MNTFHTKRLIKELQKELEKVCESLSTINMTTYPVEINFPNLGKINIVAEDRIEYQPLIPLYYIDTQMTIVPPGTFE